MLLQSGTEVIPEGIKNVGNEILKQMAIHYIASIWFNNAVTFLYWMYWLYVEQ